MSKLRSVVIIPTYNGGILWKQAADNLSKYYHGKVIVIDSSSNDDSVSIAEKNGFDVHVIPSKDFNHGGTRNLGAELAMPFCDIVIFLTQDAILQDMHSIPNLVNAFIENPRLAAIYGKQLPHDDANPIARHARYFNYSNSGYLTDQKSCHDKGLKAVFMSNSFAAYRVSYFNKQGGFADDTILCEDMLYAAKSLAAGYEIGYCSESCVKHSHNYTPLDEFKRYFDIGVFHYEQAWISKQYGGANSEGTKFIKSELSFLLKKSPQYIPLAILNTLAKFLGYKMGKKYKYIPMYLIKKLSMHKKYWE